MPSLENIHIRKIKISEIPILEEMLYQSIYQKDELNLIPRSVIDIPEVKVYIDAFGQKKDDYCLVADLDGKIVGAVWVRILADKIKGFGNIDNQTPEFAISLFKEYRNFGLGTQLMNKMIVYLKEKGYQKTSLSVQKENYAVKLYKNLGFKIIDKNKDDYIMLMKLHK